MTRLKLMWLGCFLLIAFIAVSFQGDARDGSVTLQRSPMIDAPGFIPVQCDPNTDPECNLPPPGNEGEAPTTGPGATEPRGVALDLGDRDRDGVLDPADTCPDTFGWKPDGCPLGEDNPTVGFGAASGTASALAQIVSSTVELSEGAQERCLVINEVLWAGTNFSKKHQYIELYNRCQQVVSLDGLQLLIIDKQEGSTRILDTIGLQGEIERQGYYLVVNNNLTVTDIRPDLLAGFRLFSKNTAIVLSDRSGAEFSSANLTSGKGWFAGATTRAGTFSMERDEANLDAPDISTSWHSNDAITRVGVDALGEPINGTPRHPNSPAPKK